MAKEDAPEKPQIEEPKEPQEKELTPEERMAAVISKLDGMGITDEAKVDNLATWLMLLLRLENTLMRWAS
jgi:hypothetical protein